MPWTWASIAVVIIGALLGILLLIGVISTFRSWYNPYSRRNIEISVKEAYRATGKNADHIEIVKLAEIQPTDVSNRCLWDIRIRFIGGEYCGIVADFRYCFLINAENNLSVVDVRAAPSNSPLHG